MSSGWFETVAVARRRARKQLPKSVYWSIVAGSEQGATLTDNVAAFGELGFTPHAAGLPAKRDLATAVLGQPVSMPVICSPTGVQAVHPRRRGRGRPRGGEPGHRGGAELVRQQAGRGGGRGQPPDVLPGLLDRQPG